MNFYGGQPGNSFVLKETFLSVEDMYAAFMKGPDYTDVWYNEYCVIDTPNKNDFDNGKIYRRGVNYAHIGQDANGNPIHDGGAEYIGQFVGTSSGTPWFSAGTLDSVRAKAAMDVDTSVYQEKTYPVSYNAETGNFELYQDRDNDGVDPDLGVFDFDSHDDNGMLVPGKGYDENGNAYFNDAIKWTWCNVRTNDTNNDSWFYVGFQIPYPVVEFDGTSIEPYKEDGSYDGDVYCTRDDDGEHNFYKHYTIEVPKGVKGDAISNVRRHVVTSTDIFYNPTDISYDGGKLKAGKPTYLGTDHSGTTVILYDILCYDEVNVPQPVTVFLTEYNEIVSANMRYTGEISLFTNNGGRIDIMQADADGNTVSGNGKVTTFQAKYVDKIVISTDDEMEADKRVYYRYNTEYDDEPSHPIGSPINYVMDVVVDHADYHLVVLFNDPTHRAVDVGAADTVKLDDDNYMDAAGCTWRRNVDLSTASAETQKILGWDNGAKAYTGTLHDTVFWRDYGAVKDQSGLLIGLNVAESVLQSALSLGNERPTDEQVVSYLNNKYQGGLTGANTGDGSLAGKMVTVGDNPYDKRFYAYDYQLGTWFFVGKTNENDNWDVKIVAKDYYSESTDDAVRITKKDYEDVNLGGLVFLERTDDTQTEAVPRFWKPTYDCWDTYECTWHHIGDSTSLN